MVHSEETMKIASHLWKSPLGVFYFRETEQKDGRQRSRRISLRTKDPAQAKSKALQLLANIANDTTSMSRITKFEVAIYNGGLSIKTDPDKEDDITNLGKFLTEHKNTLKELLSAQAAPQPQTQIVAPAHHDAQYSATFESLIPKYETRKAKELAPKTLYQYLQYIRKFVTWAEEREGYKPLLMYQIDKRFISQYIGHLQANNFNNRNISEKYLRTLNTFFDFAISIGEFPDIAAPSRGHKLKLSNQEKISQVQRDDFSIDDLKKIFDPNNLLSVEHPDSFWLPILGLFSGARMNELCKLSTLDIGDTEGIPTLNITDEIGTLKTEASKRKIPIHPEIIKMGFLEYVADVKKYGYMLFPNLQPDRYDSYIKEPSRRFGAYLDKIGIPEASKVFHSFRATTNNTLKQNGIREEVRCEYIGHEHKTTNTEHYTKKYNVQFLHANVIPQITFDLDLSEIRYKQGMFDTFIAKRMRELARRKKKTAVK